MTSSFAPEFVIDPTKLPCGAGLYRLRDADGNALPECAKCGDPMYYCTFSQQSLRVTVDQGHFTTGGADDGTERSGQALCAVGHFCEGGVQRPCAAGFLQPYPAQSACLPCGSVDVVCPFDPAGRTASLPVAAGSCSQPVSEAPPAGSASNATVPLEFGPEWEMKDRRYEQKARGAVG